MRAEGMQPDWSERFYCDDDQRTDDRSVWIKDGYRERVQTTDFRSWEFAKSIAQPLSHLITIGM